MSLNKKHELVEIAKIRCRENRKKQTEAESLLWEVLRNRKLNGIKFNRQHPIFHDYTGKETFYILDFFCADANLAIEVDGPIHDYQKDMDKEKNKVIELLGIKLIRIKNEDIEKNLEDTLNRIKEVLGL